MRDLVKIDSFDGFAGEVLLQKEDWEGYMQDYGLPFLIALIKAIVRLGYSDRNHIRKKVYSLSGVCPYLLPNPNTKLPYSDIKKAFQKARKEADLEEVCLHTLRHTAASWFLAKGVDIYITGKILGHSSIASTARYSHVANDSLLSAVDAGATMLDEK